MFNISYVTSLLHRMPFPAFVNIFRSVMWTCMSSYLWSCYFWESCLGLQVLDHILMFIELTVTYQWWQDREVGGCWRGIYCKRFSKPDYLASVSGLVSGLCLPTCIGSCMIAGGVRRLTVRPSYFRNLKVNSVYAQLNGCSTWLLFTSLVWLAGRVDKTFRCTPLGQEASLWGTFHDLRSRRVEVERSATFLSSTKTFLRRLMKTHLTANAMREFRDRRLPCLLPTPLPMGWRARVQNIR